MKTSSRLYMFIISKNGFWLRIIWCKINALSGWGIETFNILPSQKNTNLGSSPIHLVGVDMIEIAKFNINYKNVLLWYKNA